MTLDAALAAYTRLVNVRHADPRATVKVRALTRRINGFLDSCGPKQMGLYYDRIQQIQPTLRARVRRVKK